MSVYAGKKRPHDPNLPYTLIAPSLLSANFLNLAEDIKLITAAGADWIHLDIMDGHFVPNISFGPMIVNFARQATGLYLDAHLMIEYPENYIEAFIKAGADNITVHAEADGVAPDTLKKIKVAGTDAGISLNPETPLEALDPYWDLADLILVMSVHPGFGGQKFIEASFTKVQQIAARIEREGRSILIQIDGGIGVENAAVVRQAGARVLVAGNSIFRAPDPIKALQAIREAADIEISDKK